MNLLQRYSKLKKLNQEPDLSGDRYLEHIDYIIKASTPVKNKDYFDGKDGYTPIKGIDYSDGSNGRDGKDGYTPIKNKDYFDGVNGKDGYTPVKGKDYFDGKSGKDGRDGKDGLSFKAVSLTPRAIRDKLEDLEGESRLDASAIKNIELYANNRIVTTAGNGSTSQEPTTWGTITGTLSTQTDLTEYIDNKILINDTSDNINAIVYAIALG